MYFRMQLSGMLGGIEVFTVNPVFDVEGELTEGWDQTTANAMVTAAAAVQIPSALTVLASTAATFTEWRMEARKDADDSLIGVAAASYTGTQPTTGNKLIQVPQAAVVLSLRTDSPGASGRGRLYWPALGASIGSNMRLGAPSAGQVSTAATTYLNDVRLALQSEATAFPPWASIQLAVRSKTTKTTPHVVRVMVGDVIDTQRRRRDALPENYSISAFPPA